VQRFILKLWKLSTWICVLVRIILLDVGNMEIAGMQNVKVVIDGNRPWQKKQSNVQAE
jgi:hypothetical protein